jgi:ABC-type maltose transport system permease subunit
MAAACKTIPSCIVAFVVIIIVIIIIVIVIVIVASLERYSAIFIFSFISKRYPINNKKTIYTQKAHHVYQKPLENQIPHTTLLS